MTGNQWIVELTDWKFENFSLGPRPNYGWYRQALSLNGNKLVPENDSMWSIPRVSLEQATGDRIFAYFTCVDPMVSILFNDMRDRIYPFPNFYSQLCDWEDAKQKCDTILKMVQKWDKLKIFL